MSSGMQAAMKAHRTHHHMRDLRLQGLQPAGTALACDTHSRGLLVCGAAGQEVARAIQEASVLLVLLVPCTGRLSAARQQQHMCNPGSHSLSTGTQFRLGVNTLRMPACTLAVYITQAAPCPVHCPGAACRTRLAGCRRLPQTAEQAARAGPGPFCTHRKLGATCAWGRLCSPRPVRGAVGLARGLVRLCSASA